MSSARLLLVLPLVVLLTQARAFGQVSPADRALATDLFQRGRAALLAQSYGEACPLLEESQRLDPAGGTLLNLALCHEQIGRTATAWSEFLEGLSVARRDHREDRMRFASEHIAALELRLSRLVVQVALDPDTPGLRVERDGTVLGRSVWGVAMPVDPGEHTVRVSAEGHRAFEQTVVVKDHADVVTVTVAQLEPETLVEPAPELPVQPSAVEPPVAQAGPMAVPVAAALPAAPARLPRARRSALALWSLSLASAIAATACGVRAFALRDDAEKECQDGRCAPDAFRLNDRAARFADSSTVLSVVSGMSAAGGLYLWFVPAREPSAQRASFGLGVHGSF